MISQSFGQQIWQSNSSGIIDDSYKLLSYHPDVVIMADCKRVAKGLRAE